MGLFNKDKSTVIKGAVDLLGNIRGMIDDSKFTKQEQANLNFKLADASAQFVKDTMAENTERSRTRRSVAIIFIWFFCAIFVLIVALWKLDPEWSAFVKKLAIEFQLPGAFIAIMTFFFGAHLIRSYKGNSENKG